MDGRPSKRRKGNRNRKVLGLEAANAPKSAQELELEAELFGDGRSILSSKLVKDALAVEGKFAQAEELDAVSDEQVRTALCNPVYYSLHAALLHGRTEYNFRKYRSGLRS